MITGKAGPAFQHRTIEEALQQSLWLIEGRNSAGERLPRDWELEVIQTDLALLVAPDDVRWRLMEEK